MSLPQIPSMDPETIPATNEASYPDMYITSMHIVQLPDGRQQVATHLHNYNKETGELSPRRKDGYGLQIEDIWVEAERCPLFAEMVGGIVVITSLLYQERWLEAKIASTEGDTSELETSLAAVKQALGIVE